MPAAAPTRTDAFFGEPLQPQDLAITLLGAYVRLRPRAVWSGGMVRLLGDFGFSPAASRVALGRLVRREILEREKRGRAVFYRLTRRSEQLLADGDRRIFGLGLDSEGADVWTVLWHWVPEERRLERARLARRLRFLGFGSTQDGTWVSPHDREPEVAALVEELRVQDHVGLLLGRPATSVAFAPVVARAWDLPRLAERYRAFLDEFGPFRRPRKRAGLDDRGAFVARTRLVHVFRGFASLDPELPASVMSGADVRAEAVRTFHDVYRDLAAPAQRYFDAQA